MSETEINPFIPVDRRLEFKVNRFMLKIGFVWENEPNTNIRGHWTKDGQQVSQLQAIAIYTGINKWWRFWL